MKDYICEVIDEDAEREVHTYRVNAPNEEMAILLAFAMDGGLTCEANLDEPAQEWNSMVELAKMYVTARLAE